MLEMKLEIVPQTGMRQVLENPIGKVYDVIDYWQSQPQFEATLQVGNKAHKVKYVFAPPAWLNYIARGEKFGAYLGDMIFVNSQLQERNPDYIPYVLLKLHGEKFVSPGLDTTGRAQHWQSLWATIRVAGQVMDPNSLYSFLKDLEAHERSGFFELDGEVRRFMEDHQGDLLQGKREYLERHHENQWVARGRNEEVFASLGINDPGFRNHAEAIMSSIRDLDLYNLYLATSFVRSLAAVEPDTSLLINRPYNSFAYALTRDGNGLTDLVKFIEAPEVKEGDVIIKLPGRIQTWTALSKRLAYTMHGAEKKVRQLAEREKFRLDGLIIEAGQQASQFEQEIGLIRQLVTNPNRFEEARKKLQGLPAYREQVARLDELSGTIAGRMQELEELSQLLKHQI
ncbi:MAG: hypothetical protein Q8Q31_05015 [Nanoarchaeota archaeon]|nr:hypothetical protein [Nanoarchaeota archaeon]